MVATAKVLLYLSSTTNNAGQAGAGGAVDATNAQAGNDLFYRVSGDQATITLGTQPLPEDYIPEPEAYQSASSFKFFHIYDYKAPIKEIYERNVRKLFQHLVDGYNLTFLAVGTTPVNARMLLVGAKKERIPVGFLELGLNEIFDLTAGAKKKAKTAEEMEFQLRLRVVAVLPNQRILDLLAEEETYLRVEETVEYGFVLPESRANVLMNIKDLLEPLERLKSRVLNPPPVATLYQFILTKTIRKPGDFTGEPNVTEVISKAVFVDLPNIQDAFQMEFMVQFLRALTPLENEQERPLAEYRANELNKLLAPTIQGNSMVLTMVNLDVGGSVSYQQAAQVLWFSSQMAGKPRMPVLNTDNQLLLDMGLREELMTYRRMAMVVRDFIPDQATAESEQSSAIILRLHQETTRLQEEKADLQRRLADLETLKVKVASAAADEGHVADEEMKRELQNLRYRVRILTEVEADFKRRWKEMEAEHFDVIAELTALRKNFTGVKMAHQNEIRRNEMLGLELLGIVKAKELLVKERDARTREFSQLSQDYNKLLEEHGKLLTRDGRDSKDIDLLRQQMDEMRSHLSVTMKSMEQRLVILQQENSALEKTIHDMNTSKALDARERAPAKKVDPDEEESMMMAAAGGGDPGSAMQLSSLEGSVLKRRVDLLQEQLKDQQSNESSQRDREERQRQEVLTLTRRSETLTTEYRSKLDALTKQVSDQNALLIRISKSANAAMPTIDLRKVVHEIQEELAKTYVEKERSLQSKFTHTDAMLTEMRGRYERMRKHMDALVDQVLRDAASGMAPKDRQLLKEEIRRMREDLDALQSKSNEWNGGGAGGGGESLGSSLVQQQLETENRTLKLDVDTKTDELTSIKADLEAAQQKLQRMERQSQEQQTTIQRQQMQLDDQAAELQRLYDTPNPHPTQPQQPQQQPRRRVQPPVVAPPTTSADNMPMSQEAERMIQNLRQLLLARQRAWDEERAKLMVRCTIAEQQLEEMNRLRKLAVGKLKQQARH